jgi:hypothetical protein
MNKLKKELEQLIGKTITEKEIEIIINIYKQQHKDNLIYIEKLKRKRILEIKRINGGLKQTINDHGPITKQLIGSASKRIWGSLLSNEKETSLLKRFANYFGFFKIK